MKSMLALALALLLAGAALSNPIVGPSPERTDELVAAWLEGQTPETAAQLLRTYRQIGLSPYSFTEKSLELHETHFDHFADLLLVSQSPGGRLHGEIHALFEQVADADQRAALRATLRSWLSADGSSILEKPESFDSKRGRNDWLRRVMMIRIQAAKHLADLQDEMALPLLETLKGSEEYRLALIAEEKIQTRPKIAMQMVEALTRLRSIGTKALSGSASE